MATDDRRFVTHLLPVDVTSVRDPGMQAVIVLAASLGWNVHQKQNQPVVVTARDGTQKRLPTNTSIRMGVFQSALSTVMAHTDLDVVATPELMDAIIATTKPSVDHQRRLRLAVGETPAQHRERVAAHEAEAKGPREPEHLTQRIAIPLASTNPDVEWAEPPAEIKQPDDHGELVSREPFMARRSGNKNRTGIYQSDTSYERVWEDGYRDYECMICGAAFPTPRGVGGHIQIHEGRERSPIPAWKRSEVRYVTNREESEIEWEEPPEVPDMSDDFEPIEPPLTDEEWQPFAEAIGIEKVSVPPDAGAGTILQAIIDLVAPELVKELEGLRDEVINLRAERDQLAANLQALKDLIGGL